MAQASSIYDPARTYEFEVKDIEYRRDGDEAWLSRMYLPKGTGPFPAILDVHGGAWNNGDRTNNPQLGEGLAASGVVVASIDFRCGGEHPYPSSLQDINYATRWLKAHARDFNAEAETVGGLGVSSGGHLIVLSAMRPGDPRYTSLPLPEAPNADATLAYVVSCWGVLDSYGRYVMAKELGRQEVAASHDRYFLTAEAMQEGNPLMILQRGEHVELPPTLLIQGTADEGVPKGMAENFVSLYQKAGGSIERPTYEGMPHGIAGWSEPQIKRMIEHIKAFIAQHLTQTAAAD